MIDKCNACVKNASGGDVRTEEATTGSFHRLAWVSARGVNTFLFPAEVDIESPKQKHRHYKPSTITFSSETAEPGETQHAAFQEMETILALAG